MPVWILTLWKILKPVAGPLAAAALAVGLFHWWSSAQYDKGFKDMQARLDEMVKEDKVNHAEMKTLLTQGFANTALMVATKNNAAQQVAGESKIVILKDADQRPELKDPEKGISQDVFDAINRTKMESHK